MIYWRSATIHYFVSWWQDNPSPHRRMFSNLIHKLGLRYWLWRHSWPSPPQKRTAFELRDCCPLLTPANKTHTNLSIQVLHTGASADQSGAVNLTWHILHSILNTFTCCSRSFSPSRTEASLLFEALTMALRLMCKQHKLWPQQK